MSQNRGGKCILAPVYNYISNIQLQLHINNIWYIYFKIYDIIRISVFMSAAFPELKLFQVRPGRIDKFEKSRVV